MANTFSWTGGIGSGTIATNWEWIAGSASIVATPSVGDTAIVTAGTVLLPLDNTFSQNTVELGGTAGTVAAIQFQGDSTISLSNPTLDGSTVVESLVQGQNTAAQSVLDTLGTFVNQGHHRGERRRRQQLHHRRAAGHRRQSGRVHQ